jgi:hypothetical protein
MFDRLAPQIGRNNALFQCAMFARDYGWSEWRARALLTLTYIHAPASNGQRRDSLEQREREAQRTIASAYSRPPRRNRSERKSYLPNVIREALMTRKLTCMARVLEALHLAGVKPGQVMTHREIYAVVSPFGVGDWSVRKTLTPPAPPNTLSTASSYDKSTLTNAIFVSFAKPTKNKKGRPVTHYTIPDIDHLTTHLDVSPCGADPIASSDLQTVRTYRQALHVGLIRRRPGQYSRKLLAQRLNQHVTTVWRYCRDGGVNVAAMFKRIPLYWHNIKQYVADNEAAVVSGTFLEDRRGKRYPVRYGLACKLIKQGGAAFVKQECNHYSMGESVPMLPPAYVLEAAAPKEAAMATYWGQVKAVGDTPVAQEKEKVPESPRYQGVQTIEVHDPKWIKQKQDSAGTVPIDRDQVTYWSDRIYAAVNDKVSGQDDDKRISKQTAQQLVTEYGIKAVKRALWILGQRDNVSSPAGFLIVCLRSSRKMQKYTS